MNEALDLLSILVACPSPSGSEGAIAELVSDTARDLGLAVERFGDSLVLHASPGASPVPARLLRAARAGDTRSIRGVRLRLGGCLRQRGIDELLELDSQTLGIVAAGWDGGVGPEMFVCDVQRR